jgi:hypothetical protein
MYAKYTACTSRGAIVATFLVEQKALAAFKTAA